MIVWKSPPSEGRTDANWLPLELESAQGDAHPCLELWEFGIGSSQGRSFGMWLLPEKHDGFCLGSLGSPAPGSGTWSVVEKGGCDSKLFSLAQGLDPHFHSSLSRLQTQLPEPFHVQSSSSVNENQALQCHLFSSKEEKSP